MDQKLDIYLRPPDGPHRKYKRCEVQVSVRVDHTICKENIEDWAKALPAVRQALCREVEKLMGPGFIVDKLLCDVNITGSFKDGYHTIVLGMSYRSLHHVPPHR